MSKYLFSHWDVGTHTHIDIILTAKLLSYTVNIFMVLSYTTELIILLLCIRVVSLFSPTKLFNFGALFQI